MRILYLNPFSQEVSGPDESLLALLKALIPMDVEAHVVLPAPGPQVERYRMLGAMVHFAPLAILRRDLSMAAALYPARLGRSIIAVRQLAHRVGADLIHTNMEVLLEGGCAARTLGIPHILHYRGNTLDRPKWIFDVLTATWTTLSDHVFCISQATAGVFGRRGRAGNVEVLYNPIDLFAFGTAPRLAELRAALGAGSGQRLVGTVGRLHPRKDLETFIRAAARVVEVLEDVHFVVVGTAEAPIEREYQKRLRALVTDLGMQTHVTFAGTRRDMPAVMAALDLFVLTSRHEGFGRVVGEAMAAGLPTVVSDEGAPPELIDRDRCGVCAQPGDVDDFARQIQGLLTNPDQASLLGRRARERAALFDASIIAARVRARYEDCLARYPVRQTAAPSARAQ